MPIKIQENQVLAPYTTWKVGGAADFFVLPQNVDEVKEALKWANERSLQKTFIGGGSNILVSDRGVRGLVICMKGINEIVEQSDEENFRVVCGAGVLKMKAMRRFLKAELPPALFLSGLPGDVAGGVVMNAGVSEKVKPKEFVEVVESFKVVVDDPDRNYPELSFKNEDVQWEYRKTKGWPQGAISEVTLNWPIKDREPEIKRMVREAQELRASKQPLGEPSCGSVFQNPYNDPNNKEKRSAGYLIEKAGLKGHQYGGAEISRKHANFIINKNNATALDIHCAMVTVQKKVMHEFGIGLSNEVRYIGDWEGLL
jgi:UDP-N-acetylmuramate dehydrogenase